MSVKPESQKVPQPIAQLAIRTLKRLRAEHDDIEARMADLRERLLHLAKEREVVVTEVEEVSRWLQAQGVAEE